MVAIVISTAEPLFPQVDVNAALLIAERVVAAKHDDDWPLRFVTLKKPIAELVAGDGDYWQRVIEVIDRIYEPAASIESDDLRVKLVPLGEEREALARQSVRRNWSKYLRAPLSYYRLFGEST